MHSHASPSKLRETLWILRWTAYIALVALVAGCTPGRRPEGIVSTRLDRTQDGQHTSGAWTYTYSITNPGSRSEGCHGLLSYRQTEVPAPMRINDFYETPWGRLYWVGKPVVLFGGHGWMPTPLVREPIGRALIDPALVNSERFMVHLKVVAPEELATPDRLERDAKVLAALKPFGLTEAHVQRKWFPLGSDPITLHDTKRWGTLTVCRADKHESHAPILEFTCTNDLSAETATRPASLAEVMAAPVFLAKPHNVSLCPQVDTLQPIRCTLTPVIGDPLVLYVVCRIEDQGPKPPWKSPVIRYRETKPTEPAISGDTNQPQSPSAR